MSRWSASASPRFSSARLPTFCVRRVYPVGRPQRRVQHQARRANAQSLLWLSAAGRTRVAARRASLDDGRVAVTRQTTGSSDILPCLGPVSGTSGGHAFVGAAAVAGGDIPASTFASERRCLGSAFRAEPKLYADTTVLAMFPQSVPMTGVLSTARDVAVVDADAFVFYENDMAPAYQERAQVLGLMYATALSVPRIRS